MKLQHHLGGLDGLSGPIDFEKRVFVEDWERRIFGIHAAMMGLSDSLREALPDYDLDAVPSAFADTWTWADLRKGAEAMNPFDYFRYRYYEKWLGGITGYLVARGYVDEAELAEATDRYRAEPAAALPDRDAGAIDEQVIRYLREGDSPRRGRVAPAFAVGDRVLVGDPPPGEHTRLPGYLRGCPGTVVRVCAHSYTYFCSTGEDGLGEPVPVYVVRFEPTDVWGPTAEPNAGPLFAELYQTYLAPRPTPSQEAAR